MIELPITTKRRVRSQCGGICKILCRRSALFLLLFLLEPSIAIAAENQYLEIPLCGVFGERAYRVGDRNVVELTDNTSLEVIEQTLEFASKNGIGHIVFRIDSPGGSLSTAEAIVEVMDKYDDALEYHALVNKGLSAAIWIMFACDTIHVSSDTVIGAAVPYAGQLGAVQVDEKFNSAIAAKLATIAESKGHSTVLLRAMILRGAAVYSWTDDDGTLRISSSPPDETTGNSTQVVDTPDTVLTLTGNEAVELGLARFAPRSASDLGNALALDGWVLANRFVHIATLFDIYFHNPARIKYDGSVVAEHDVGGVTIIGNAPIWGKSRSQTRALNRNFKKQLRNVAEVIGLIEQSDPEMSRYEYSAEGELTPSSVARWKEREAKSNGLWKRLFHVSQRGPTYIHAPWGASYWPAPHPLPTKPGDAPAAVRLIWQMRNID